MRELKVKKAKFGFESYLNAHNWLQLAEVASSTTVGTPQSQSTWYVEMNHNGGSTVMKIYFNDEALYCQFKLAIA